MKTILATLAAVTVMGVSQNASAFPLPYVCGGVFSESVQLNALFVSGSTGTGSTTQVCLGNGSQGLVNVVNYDIEYQGQFGLSFSLGTIEYVGVLATTGVAEQDAFDGTWHIVRADVVPGLGVGGKVGVQLDLSNGVRNISVLAAASVGWGLGAGVEYGTLTFKPHMDEGTPPAPQPPNPPPTGDAD